MIALRPADRNPPPHVTGVARFERLFRRAGGVDIDKSDLKRYEEFVHRKLHHLLVRAEDVAKWNGRDIIEPFDLPITWGLQESIKTFRELDEDIELQPILERLAGLPALELSYSERTRAELPEIVGGLSVALARAFKILEPELKNPQSVHWERAYRIFDLLL
jgi:hypothetical protein